METATVETPYDRFFKRVRELLTKQEVEQYMYMEMEFKDISEEVSEKYSRLRLEGGVELNSQAEVDAFNERMTKESMDRLLSQESNRKIYQCMVKVGLYPKDHTATML